MWQAAADWKQSKRKGMPRSLVKRTTAHSATPAGINGQAMVAREEADKLYTSDTFFFYNVCAGSHSVGSFFTPTAIFQAIELLLHVFEIECADAADEIEGAHTHLHRHSERTKWYWQLRRIVHGTRHCCRHRVMLPRGWCPGGNTCKQLANRLGSARWYVLAGAQKRRRWWGRMGPQINPSILESIFFIDLRFGASSSSSFCWCRHHRYHCCCSSPGVGNRFDI